MTHTVWQTLRWTADLERAFRTSASPEDRPGFVIAQTGDSFQIATPEAQGTARLSGHLRYLIDLGTGTFPTVGDFVVARPAAPADGEFRIHGVLPRRNSLARRKPGKRPDEQVIAVNIDLLAIVTTGGRDFSDRRIERYAEVVAGDERPETIAVVNKCDLLDDPDGFLRYARGLLPTLGVVGVSAKTGAGIEELARRFEPGATVVLAGSSGVGKTSIIRALAAAGSGGPEGKSVADGSYSAASDPTVHDERTAGDPVALDPAELRIRETRKDGKGRHTTTVRKVYALPGGILVIDLPGMREVQVLGDDTPSSAFEDIEALAEECKFRDCRHMSEPGCAVKAAVRDGTISQERYQSYLELRDEGALNRAERQRQRELWGKAIAQATRQRKKAGWGKPL
mgnify:CR=1 FL=1